MDFTDAITASLRVPKYVQEEEEEKPLAPSASSFSGLSASGEEDPGFLGTIADVGLSGLAMAGNLLDVPGSMVRDVATWVPGGIEAQNPFDQLLSPFSSEDRVTGEEMLQSAGLVGEDTWTGLGTGIGLEIALDPLTYLTFGGSAVGKAGRAAQKAGLYKNARRAANDLAGKELGKDAGRTLGATSARQTLTPRDLIRDAGTLDDATLDSIRRSNQASSARQRKSTEKAIRRQGKEEGWSEGRINEMLEEASRRIDETSSQAFDEAVSRAPREATFEARNKFFRAGGTEEMLDERLGGIARFSIPFLSRKYGDKYPLIRERLIGTTNLTPGELASRPWFQQLFKRGDDGPGPRGEGPDTPPTDPSGSGVPGGGGTTPSPGTPAPEVPPAPVFKSPTREEFARKSDLHKRFDEELQQVVNEGALDEPDAEILRTAFFGSDLKNFDRTFLRASRPMRRGELSDLPLDDPNRDVFARGWFAPQGKVGEFGSGTVNMPKGMEVQQGDFAKAETMLHELGHAMLHNSIRRTEGGRVAYDQVIDEFDSLLKDGSLQDYFAKNYSEEQVKYLTGNPHEAFAQLFSDSILQRRVFDQQPKLKSFVEKVTIWVRDALEKMMGRSGLSDGAKKRTDALIDLISGHITPEEYVEFVGKGKGGDIERMVRKVGRADPEEAVRAAQKVIEEVSEDAGGAAAREVAEEAAEQAPRIIDAEDGSDIYDDIDAITGADDVLGDDDLRSIYNLVAPESRAAAAALIKANRPDLADQVDLIFFGGEIPAGAVNEVPTQAVDDAVEEVVDEVPVEQAAEEAVSQADEAAAEAADETPMFMGRPDLVARDDARAARLLARFDAEDPEGLIEEIARTTFDSMEEAETAAHLMTARARQLLPEYPLIVGNPVRARGKGKYRVEAVDIREVADNYQRGLQKPQVEAKARISASPEVMARLRQQTEGLEFASEREAMEAAERLNATLTPEQRVGVSVVARDIDGRFVVEPVEIADDFANESVVTSAREAADQELASPAIASGRAIPDVLREAQEMGDDAFGPTGQRLDEIEAGEASKFGAMGTEFPPADLDAMRASAGARAADDLESWALSGLGEGAAEVADDVAPMSPAEEEALRAMYRSGLADAEVDTAARMDETAEVAGDVDPMSRELEDDLRAVYKASREGDAEDVAGGLADDAMRGILDEVQPATETPIRKMAAGQYKSDDELITIRKDDRGRWMWRVKGLDGGGSERTLREAKEMAQEARYDMLFEGNAGQSAASDAAEDVALGATREAESGLNFSALAKALRGAAGGERVEAGGMVAIAEVRKQLEELGTREEIDRFLLKASEDGDLALHLYDRPMLLSEADRNARLLKSDLGEDYFNAVSVRPGSIEKLKDALRGGGDDALNFVRKSDPGELQPRPAEAAAKQVGEARAQEILRGISHHLDESGEIIVDVPIKKERAGKYKSVDNMIDIEKDKDGWYWEVDGGSSGVARTLKEAQRAALENREIVVADIVEEAEEAAAEARRAGPDIMQSPPSAMPDMPEMPEGFYLKSARAVASSNMGKAPSQQWEAILKKHGVKKEEMQDLGLDKLLERGGKITKEEIARQIERNSPRVEFVDGRGNYRDHSVPGGLEGTYREIIVHSPFGGPGWTRDMDERYRSLSARKMRPLDSELLPLSPGERDEVRRLSAFKYQTGASNPHFGEEGDRILAHLRADDVKLPGGRRALRVQEVQSDWHQAGRRGGYTGYVESNVVDSSGWTAKPILRNKGENVSQPYEVTDSSGRRIGVHYGYSPEQAIRIAAMEKKGTVVQDAPFKKSWHMLAMKEILRRAAREGYDEVRIVKGKDIAKAVGGPEEELGVFYDKILNSALRKYTKRWGSFKGVADDIDAELGFKSEGGMWLLGDDIAIFRSPDGSFVVGTTLDEFPDIRGINSLEEAMSIARDIARKTGLVNTKYSGQTQVFKITDKMREDLLGEGQPLYAPPRDRGRAGQAIDGARDLAGSALGWMSDTAPSVGRAARSGAEAIKGLAGDPDLSAKAGVAMDTIGGYVKYSAPIRMLTASFKPEVMGGTTEFGQVLGEHRYEAMKEATYEMRKRLEPISRKLLSNDELNIQKLARKYDDINEAQKHISKNYRAIRKYLEGARDTLDRGTGKLRQSALPPELQSLRPELDQMREALSEIRQIELDAGIKSPELDDMFSDYFPRSSYRFPGEKGSGRGNLGKVLDPGHKSQLPRKEFLKHIPGGTATIDEISIDPKVSGLAHSAEGKRLSREKFEAAKEYIKETYGGGLRGQRANSQLNLSDMENFDEFVNFIVNLDPRHAELQVPFFQQDPIKDFMHRMEGGLLAASAADFVTGLMANGSRRAAEQLGTIDMKKVLEGWAVEGMDKDAVKRKVIERMGDKFTDLKKELQDASDQSLADNIEFAARGAAADGYTQFDKNNQITASLGGQDVIIDGTFGDGRVGVVAQGGETPTPVDASKLRGKIVTDDDVLRKFTVDEDVMEQSKRYIKGFTEPDSIRWYEDAMRQATNLYKSSLTVAWPAFHVRNLISGQYNNYLIDASDPRFKGPRKYLQPIKDADALFRGQEVEGILDIPMIKEMGITDPEEAARVIQREIFANELVDYSQGVTGDIVGEDLATLSSQMVGQGERRLRDIIKPPPRPVGATGWDSANPMRTAGVFGETQDSFMPFRWGRQVGNYVEGLNRIAPYMALLRQGVDSREAARRVFAAQFDYTKNTPVDRKMRILFPFYSYTKNIIPFTVKQLAEAPGGKLAQTVRATSSARSDEPVPSYIAAQASIPFGRRGNLSEGDSAFITGLGLGFEDPMSLLDDSGGIMRNVFSRMNPLIKAPVEWAFGESTYFDGVDGGRPLKDMDPTYGRILSNINEITTGEESRGRAEPIFGSELAEHVMANLPTSRIGTTLRTMTDTRKLDNPLKMALNLGTGVKVSDVSQAQWDADVQNKVMERMKELGARDFVRTYFPDYITEGMDPEELSESASLEEIMRWLSNRAKERAAAN